MGRKFNYLIIAILLCFCVLPNAFAASATTKISGTSKIKVGQTTKIYLKLNSSAKIEGVDINYKSSGNIKVTNVSINSGLSKMGQNGNRYILYAPSPIKSGSTILTLTVKGTAVGKGTITVSKLEATVSGLTVNGGSKSYTITVVKDETEAEKKEEAKKKAEKEAKEKAKKEAEEKAKNEARKKSENDALELVEKAEKSLLESDYKTAKSAVDALENSGVKNDLLKRLDEVRFKIKVEEEVGKRCSSKEQCVTTKCDIESNKTPAWIILSIILFICLLFETIYIIVKVSKKTNYE